MAAGSEPEGLPSCLVIYWLLNILIQLVQKECSSSKQQPTKNYTVAGNLGGVSHLELLVTSNISPEYCFALLGFLWALV